MKYIKQFDNYFDTSAYANEIIEKPLVLLNTGGGNDDQLFFSDGELRSANYNVSDDDLLCVTSLAPFKVFKVDGGENLIPEMKTTQKRFTLNADTISHNATKTKYVSTIDPNMQYISKMLLVFENGYDTNDTLISFNDVIEFGYLGYHTGFFEILQFKPIDTIENLINDGRIKIIDNKTIDVTQLLHEDYVPNTSVYSLEKINHINSLIYAAKIQSEDNSFSLSDIINIDVIIEGIEYVTDSEAYSFNISDQNFKTMSNSSFNSHPLNYIYGAYPIDTNYDYIIEYDNDILPNDVVICASKQLNDWSGVSNIININTSEIGSVEYLTSIEKLEAEEYIININNENVIIDWSSPGAEDTFNLFPVTYLSNDIPLLDLYNEQTLNFTMDSEKNYALGIYNEEVIEIVAYINEYRYEYADLIINNNGITIPEGFFTDTRNDLYGFPCIINFDIVDDMPNNLNLVESTLIMQIAENLYKATIENNKLSISFNPSIKFDNHICFYLERDGVLLETTNTFYRTTSKLQDAYYFETAGEHTIEFEYIDKFMNSGILLKANYDNYKMTSSYVECNPLFYQLPYKINDKFFNYERSLRSYNLGYERMINDIQLSNKVPLNIGCDIINRWVMYSDKTSDPNINYDSLITINNCVIDSSSKICVYIGPGDIVIPNIVTSISSDAANGCKATSIVFPNSLTEIPQFISDTLTKIKIPSSINYINNIDCSNLAEIDISDISQFINIDKNGWWSGKPKLILNEQNITNLVVPNGTTEIKDYIFSNFSDITSVTIPDSVTSIGSSAFYGCSGLTSIDIPNIKSWMNISFSNGLFDNPLYYAKNLYVNNELITDLIIPNSVTAIKPHSFINSSLETIKIPDSVTSIGRYAFNGTTLKTINIPDSVTSIGDHAFADSSLEIVRLSDSIINIPERAFSNCKNLKSINIPNSVTSIEYRAFENCPNIEEIIFEKESYNDVETYIFNNSHIKHLSIKNLKTIPNYAFYNCSFDELTIGENLKGIGWYSFNKLSTVQKINIPSIEHWCKMYFNSNSVQPLSSGIAKLYVDDNPITDVIIPNSITTINSYAFYNYKLMTSITIPSSVTQIQNYAFDKCTGLTKVNIENIESFCKISFGTYTSSLPLYFGKNLYINDELITDLTIPDTITTLPGGIFYNCESIQKVTLPSTLTNIGSSAFRSCINLSEIICNAMTAPTISASTFRDIKTGGILKVPTGATGYDAWLSTSDYYLGKYNWSIEYI